MNGSVCEIVARQKLGLPDSWEVFKWEAKQAGEKRFVLVTGAVCEGVYLRGPRKGRKKWSSREKDSEITTAVSEAEHDEFLNRLETEEGRCKACFSSPGKRWLGWDCVSGSRYDDCPRCHGTGRAPAALSEGRSYE